MSYELFYTEEASRQIEALDKSVQIPVLKKIVQLAAHPELGKPLSNLLKNKRSVHVGGFRVVYIVSGNDVTVVRVRHRKDVYE